MVDFSSEKYIISTGHKNSHCCQQKRNSEDADRETRAFPRPFRHWRREGGGGDLCPSIWGTSAGDKALMGATHEGGHRPYGGPNFDSLCHKLKVLLLILILL